MLPETISRRSFLKSLGLAGAGLAVTGLAQPAAAARSDGPDGWRSRLHDETRLLMGTVVRITVARASKTQAEQGMGMAFAEMDRLIAIFDRHQSGTAVSVLNARQSLADAPDEFVMLAEKAKDYSLLTGGAFDVTVQPVLTLLERNGNPRGELHVAREDLDAALALVDISGLQISGRRISLARQGMGLTLDGMAKGYIVDQAAAVLKAQGLDHFLINAGGDIRVGGEKRPRAPWTVAVEDPAKQGGYPAVLHLREGAVATSGVYERYFDKSREHNHLLRPATGASPADCLSVTVKAPTAMQADALATALSVMERGAALELVNRLPGCACLFVMKNGTRTASQDWRSV